MSYIIVERGANKGERLSLVDFPIKIGRDPSNDIVINDDLVSRFHGIIHNRGKTFVIKDLGSRNGSFINGERFLNCPLKNGDRILLGDTELVFVASNQLIVHTSSVEQSKFKYSENISNIVDDHHQQKLEYQDIERIEAYSIEQLVCDSSSSKMLFDLHGNILSHKGLEEIVRSILKSISMLSPKFQQAAFFVWDETHHDIHLFEIMHFGKKKPVINIENRFIENAIARKMGILIKVKQEDQKQNGPSRIILPITTKSSVVGVVQVDLDETYQSESLDEEIKLAQSLLLRAASEVENVLLQKDLDKWMIGMIETIISAVEAKDTYTRGHSERVSRYSMAIASELHLNKELKKLLLMSSLCHDIGKIGVPDAILKKASGLTPEEYNEMKQHPTIGAEIVNHIPNAKRFISGILHHHEKWDGTGYPDGLAGDKIPFFGRIIAIADVFDAMVSGRSYSGFIGQQEAVERLIEEGELFDPEILAAFVKAHETGSLTLKTSTQAQKDQDELSLLNGDDKE